MPARLASTGDPQSFRSRPRRTTHGRRTDRSAQSVGRSRRLHGDTSLMRRRLGSRGRADPARHRSTPPPLQRALYSLCTRSLPAWRVRGRPDRRSEPTLSNFLGTPILIAAAAGQLHRVTEARAAFDALEAHALRIGSRTTRGPFLPRGLGTRDSSTHCGRVRESKGARYRSQRGRVISPHRARQRFPHGSCAGCARSRCCRSAT